MKKAFCFILAVMVIFPMGFRLEPTHELLENSIISFNKAVDTVSALVGGNRFNNTTNLEGDISNLQLEIGAGGVTERVGDYVEWRIKRDMDLMYEDSFYVKYVNNELYSLEVRNGGDIKKHDYTAMALTVGWNTSTGYKEYDCLWIGCFTFDNWDGEEWKGASFTDNLNFKYYTQLYTLQTDFMLDPLFSYDILTDVTSDIQFGIKFPSQVVISRTKFTDFWDEWTGG